MRFIVLEISPVEEWNYLLNLLLDDSVSEVETNGPASFFIKKSGQRIHLENIPERSPEDYVDRIKKGLLPFVRAFLPFEEQGYLFEGPLDYTAGGKRVRGRCHIVLPPAADHATITIAKKSTALSDIDKIAAAGSMSTEMLEFIKVAVKAGLTIVLSGGTGAGKTTMLESITKLIPLDVRIGVAEDTPELSLIHKNVPYLHSVPWKPGMDPNKVATLSWVVQQYQRMRTDRIIIGEVRGKEFNDFLIAANSGMEGSLITLHADDPRAALRKMTSFVSDAKPGTPIRTINNDIATGIDLIIQLVYFQDGRYRVSQIEEITNVVNPDESAQISTGTLYKYNPLEDNWTKVSHMTDSLREKFQRKSINIQPFLNSAIDVKQLRHSGGEDPRTNMTPQSNTPQSGVHQVKQGIPTQGLPINRNGGRTI